MTILKDNDPEERSDLKIWFGGIVLADEFGMFKEGDLIKPRWITEQQANRIIDILEEDGE